MFNFTRVLHQLITEHELTQVGLSALTGIDNSKISRLLSETTKPDDDDLNRLLLAFRGQSERFDLVYSFIRDKCGEEALTECEIQPKAQLSFRDGAGLNIQTLSLRGQRALAYLLFMRSSIPQIEDLFLDLARALGWDDKL